MLQRKLRQQVRTGKYVREKEREISSRVVWLQKSRDVTGENALCVLVVDGRRLFRFPLVSPSCKCSLSLLLHSNWSCAFHVIASWSVVWSRLDCQLLIICCTRLTVMLDLSFASVIRNICFSLKRRSHPVKAWNCYQGYVWHLSLSFSSFVYTSSFSSC